MGKCLTPGQLATLGKVQAVIAQELGRNVEAETTLEALGLDSLEFVALMQAVGREVGEIPEARWGEISTVGDIAEHASRDI